jgi:hypothetical protein
MWKSSVGEIAGLVGLVGILVGCVPAHPYSMKDEGEKVSVDVLKPDDVRSHASGGGEKSVPPTVLAVAVPVAANYVIKNTAPALDEDSKEHAATYYGAKAASRFYAEEKTGSSVQLAGLRITRSIINDGKIQTAAILTFLVDTQELPTNGQLQLVGDSALLHFGKLKVEDRKWYIPWTWFKDVRDRIDADVNIVIEGHWIDDKNSSHREDVADLNLRLRDLKLGDTTNISTVRSEWFPLIPRSQKPKLGTGTYVVKVKVTEYDDYGKHIKEVADVVSTNRVDWVNTIKKSFTPNP